MIRNLYRFIIGLLLVIVGSLLTFYLFTGLEFNVSFNGHKAKEKTIDIMTKVKNGLKLAKEIKEVLE